MNSKQDGRCRTCSESCIVMGFGINDVELSDYITRELVNQLVSQSVSQLTS
jgi:hypothetical protein